MGTEMSLIRDHGHEYTQFKIPKKMMGFYKRLLVKYGIDPQNPFDQDIKFIYFRVDGDVRGMKI